ncbi:DNA-directed RNA polymerase subunit beta' [Candidatus Giovannonibacteria bacterium RIFCSPHIGHO2_02_43_13]|uniref:DNA-directed RNA polymerase subunit beta' n=1 Tax=Candidatus Giovannonibacteria bacterium RIFCSPHIGHO2_02_43_13 TaxID=1798330 RepID=A0A1F5WUM1_9BACT|nr:MAG: DNA-directed RNA polymerase subunit beta' [Parcubacteria group bacterium GW2011_GWA2_44_13]OGF72973.1 MAG: DNA-directed RNA polymerase subunit beta' [Candidatus Giovannonibacteria bacterium RIFCSPHIGHO2_12_FULL_44_42]OGF79342.1 MAG: DNA-directed RNA polymerase subunit beta' [Candidatus Giovannonibacteria bacterium RIFCSPHIGHO2_02_43_13]OGF90271.1 MAG: DNA-directed RNA polymerase subunit beta' [Candidatus Giovannonibacteria bacterium RIFCSPLOWO2_02_FULL_43_54]OGF97253.1 MAG: DNA-directed
MEQKITDFKSLMIRMASPEKILSWSRGEVTKPETINYRTQRPEKDGLFDERIFGPEKDFECYCGKYKRVRYKGIVCDKCGVEVTRSIVRRERMGHIELAAPVSHIWFLRGVPSRVGILLDVTVGDLEKVIYFGGYIITYVDEKAREEVLVLLEKEFKSKSKSASGPEKEALKNAMDAAKAEIKGLKPMAIVSEVEYHRLSLKYASVFEAGIGAESLRKICGEIDLKKLSESLEKEIITATMMQKKKVIRRLHLVRSMLHSGVKPEWMFLKEIPVIPPALRPMVQLEGGRHATSDINDLYRRVINRNNRLRKLLEIKAPEVIVRNEKRMLQEAVDALIDNSIKRSQGPAATSQAQKRPLRSLADMLKGKQGRFRQNLLGKRVDYSGRSVIVVGPELKLNQCGLPKHMALELFRPFVIQKLIARNSAHTIRGAGRLIDDLSPEIWECLEEVIEGKCVLLNRAPTLHRLGIQAFFPKLIEGNAIQLHPLVCTAFNADFDGDQMAVHVPLTNEAQQEARELMLSARNLLKPGNGEPVITPTQDIVMGVAYLTRVREGSRGEGKYFASPNEAILAYDFDKVSLQAKIFVRVTKTQKYQAIQKDILETSVGRLVFNSVIPRDYPYLNSEMKKKDLERLVSDLIGRYGVEETPPILDRIKSLGYRYATKAGISWGMDDIKVPAEKYTYIDAAKAEAKVIEDQYGQGLLTDRERYEKIISIWGAVKAKIDKLAPATLDPFGPIHYMVNSGARGNWTQINQLASMKGLVVNPAGRIIELPILSSYKEGLNVLEYFISTHAARKGTADTALKTAVAGYLTRRLVDVVQDVIVSEPDCKDETGFEVFRKDYEKLSKNFALRIFGRVLARDVVDPEMEKVVVKKGHLLTMPDAEKVASLDVPSVLLRSPVACKTVRGICQLCYGYDLGSNTPIKLGEAVGIVAAQAIGEPGTQLTMRTFHVGGVAGAADITMGLPRVEEIFEMRLPKVQSMISDVHGQVTDIAENTVPGTRDKLVHVTIDKDKDEEKREFAEYVVPFGKTILVNVGDKIEPGMKITEGAIDIKELLRVAGAKAVQNYIIFEVQQLYTFQGAAINDKHIEVIVRQIFSRVRVKDPGSTELSVGDIIEKAKLREENLRAKREGRPLAKAVQLAMGITNVALTTESFLSAASFMQTMRVLTNAAIDGKEDRLRGLKENVIIGRLIPAGTGYRKEYLKKLEMGVEEE